MALNAYLKLKGSTMGDIRGSVTQKGREGRILILGSSHALGSAEAGLPLQHQPYELVKPVDQATPLLYQALVSGEVFSDCEIQYWTPRVGGSSAAGTEVQHYTVKLINARLLDIAFEQPLTLDPLLAKWPESETLRLGYEQIEWRWNSPLKTATADAKPKARAARKKSG